TRPMLVEQAQQELKRRGWTSRMGPGVMLQREAGVYPFLAEKQGVERARERILSELPPYTLSLRFPGEPRGPTLRYGLDGRLQALDLPIVGWVPPGAGVPYDEALHQAQVEVETLYGVDTAKLELEYGGPLTPQEGRRGHRFQWMQPDTTGLVVRYQVDVYDRVTQVQR